MKIVTIIGARPQFIKAAVVSRAFATHPGIQEIIVHTGQHYDSNMSEVFFEEMDIPKPDYNLNINGLSHGAMTGQMIESIERILIDAQPDWVLVYGDTNSTLAGALAAKKLHLKVAHVEAGLRSYNMDMPEEINRILTDRISNFLICPTDQAVANLKKEGFDSFGCNIAKHGDVMQDAALFYKDKSKKPKVQIPEKYILCTIHRAENTDNPNRLRSILNTLDEISRQVKVVLPLHPRTKTKLIALGYQVALSNILFIDPVGYLEMVWMLKHCEWVMTDSGGLQKEAFFFEKFCLTLREETEWVELVENGYNWLTGVDENRINSAIDEIKRTEKSFGVDFYGNGMAGSRIVNDLLYMYTMHTI